jgi:KDO2-lipid IV(A) lauroyltransferase
MSLAHALEASLAEVALGALSPLPWSTARGVGAALGSTMGRLGLRRNVARANLALAFPERTQAEREAILEQHYVELGRIAAEYGRLPELARAADGEVLASVEGLEPIRALAGRGAFAVSGHLGNFELGAAWLSRVNPVDFLVKPLSNRAVDARISRLRRDAGVGLVSTHGGVKEVFKALKAGRWVAIAADQDAGRHGVFVPFFGRLASTAEGVARLALQTGAPVFVATISRRPDGRHRLVFEPPRFPSGPADETSVTELTAWHTALLEHRIREAPEQYFWLHRRWKTRPKSETASR